MILSKFKRYTRDEYITYQTTLPLIYTNKNKTVLKMNKQFIFYKREVNIGTPYIYKW